MINPRQVSQAIAPLAETLFPTSRIPIFRFEGKEGWIVFEEPTPTSPRGLILAKDQVKGNRRTTLTSYQSPKPFQQGGLQLSIPIRRDGMPSAPLRQTSSEELVEDLALPLVGQGQPVSAGVGSKAKKSFMRPFLLGKSKKGLTMKEEVERSPLRIPELRHPPRTEHHENPSDRPESGFQMIDSSRQAVSGIRDDYLHVEVPESPYEENAYISDNDDTAPTPGLSSRTIDGGAEAEEIPNQIVDLRVDLEVKALTPVNATITPSPSPSLAAMNGQGQVNPNTLAQPISPAFGIDSPLPLSLASEVTPTTAIPSSPVPNSSRSAPTPMTAIVQVSPILPATPSRSLTPLLPLTPLTPLVPTAEHTPPLTPISIPLTPIDQTTKTASVPNTPLTPLTSISIPIPTTHRQQVEEDSSKPKGRSSRDHSPKDRSRIKDDNERKRPKDKTSRKSRASNTLSEEQDTWLELVFEDLPFGPDKNMVSPLFFFPQGEADNQYRAIETIKKDWKIFTAEIICLVGFAYIIQVSGW